MGFKSFIAKTFGITRQDVRLSTQGTNLRGWQGNTPNTPKGGHLGLYWTKADNGVEGSYFLMVGSDKSGRQIRQQVNLAYVNNLVKKSTTPIVEMGYGKGVKTSLRGTCPDGTAFTLVDQARVAYETQNAGARPFTGTVRGAVPSFDDSPIPEETYA